MILNAKKLHKGFQTDGERIEILRGVDFSIEKPEIIALMGRSGSGKSTLLSILTGLDRPDSGELEILGVNVLGMSADLANRFRFENIGIIFQQFHLLDHLTARENVRLAWDLQRKPGADEHALKQLEKVGLLAREKHFPSKLSKGECQRVAIARLLMLEPKIVFADEPTGSLDARTGNEIVQLLFSLTREQGATLVVVTHDQELASRCDRIFTLKDGVLGDSSSRAV